MRMRGAATFEGVELGCEREVGQGFKEGRGTFCGIGSLVVFGEPLQVLVLKPRNPVVVLAVVEFAGLLLVGLTLGVLLVVCHLHLSLLGGMITLLI